MYNQKAKQEKEEADKSLPFTFESFDESDKNRNQGSVLRSINPDRVEAITFVWMHLITTLRCTHYTLILLHVDSSDFNIKIICKFSLKCFFIS